MPFHATCWVRRQRQYVAFVTVRCAEAVLFVGAARLSPVSAVAYRV